MFNKSSLSLNSPIAELTNLLRVELWPSVSIELQIEANQKDGMGEVNEGISHIALVSEINGQIEEIKLTFMVLIQIGEEHFLVVLIRNILDHESCPFVSSSMNGFEINREAGRITDSLLTPGEARLHVASAVKFAIVGAR